MVQPGATRTDPADGAATGRRYHHGDLPSALLTAVDELIREEGLEAVTLRAAARRAGVSHAAPAHHFGDKAGLLAAFAAQGFAAFTRALEDARDAVDGPPGEQLLAMGHAYLAFAREHQPWFEVMFRKELLPGHTDEVHDAGGRAFVVLQEQLGRCLDDEATELDALALALPVWTIVHGLAQLSVDGPLDHMELPLDASEPVMALLTAGLRAHPRWRG